ncbi:rhox homeobox family member 2B [Saimiri boliviensis]|uniref:Homeobox domain-containing protein n=1 Tax=Saimiri boliviensis boliviensis TaxID=39432 RepID=A0A2K6SYM5_SAIBB
MEPLDRSSQGITSMFSPEVDEEEILQGLEAAVLSLIEESDEEEGETQPKPEQGTAAAAQKSAGAYGGEENVGGGISAGAPGPLKDENHEGIGGSNGGGEHSEDNNREPRQEPPPQGASSGLEPDNRQRPFVQSFTASQRRELEGIFRRSQFPGEFLRNELARRMNVTEVAVQIWFENRRARWRRRQRALRLRNMSRPMHTSQLVMVPVVIPYNAILIQEWDGRWFFLQPQLFGQPVLPMTPFSPLFFSPSPLLNPPMPYPVQAQFVPFSFVFVHFFAFSIV